MFPYFHLALVFIALSSESTAETAAWSEANSNDTCYAWTVAETQPNAQLALRATQDEGREIILKAAHWFDVMPDSPDGPMQFAQTVFFEEGAENITPVDFKRDRFAMTISQRDDPSGFARADAFIRRQGNKGQKFHITDRTIESHHGKFSTTGLSDIISRYDACAESFQ